MNNSAKLPIQNANTHAHECDRQRDTRTYASGEFYRTATDDWRQRLTRETGVLFLSFLFNYEWPSHSCNYKFATVESRVRSYELTGGTRNMKMWNKTRNWIGDCDIAEDNVNVLLRKMGKNKYKWVNGALCESREISYLFLCVVCIFVFVFFTIECTVREGTAGEQHCRRASVRFTVTISNEFIIIFHFAASAFGSCLVYRWSTTQNLSYRRHRSSNLPNMYTIPICQCAYMFVCAERRRHSPNTCTYIQDHIEHATHVCIFIHMLYLWQTNEKIMKKKTTKWSLI